MSDWAEKYRPRSLSEIIGNAKAIEELKSWADAWRAGKQSKRAVVLMGDPGVGKTTSALALANDNNWQVVEMNASDSRNAEAIKRVAMQGALGETITDTGSFTESKTGQRKLIILDEADNIFGKEDFGGVKAVAHTIINAQQPVILIVNDWYSLRRRSSEIASNVKTISFQKPRVDSIAKLLRRIANAEGVSVSEKVVAMISEKSEGDVRSAINDLQSIAEGRSKVSDEDALVLGSRDTTQTIFKSLAVIFRTGNCKRSRDSLKNLDEDPESIILWIDENLPIAYREPGDLYTAYEALAKADRFLGLVSRRQYYGLWSYAGEMMSAGVSLAKSRDYSGYVKYSFPRWLAKMSSSKGYRETRKSFAGKLGNYTHTSVNAALQEALPYFRTLYMQDREFRLTMTKKLNLDEEEVGFLLDEKPDSHPVRHVFDALRKVEAVEEQDEGKSEEEEPEEKGGGKKEERPEAQPDAQSKLFEFM
jgi:replication factor C large subunit